MLFFAFVATAYDSYSKNTVPDANAFLLRLRPVEFFFVSSVSGRVQNRGCRMTVDPQGAECGWKTNGTRTQKERVRVRKDIFTVLFVVCSCWLIFNNNQEDPLFVWKEGLWDY
jgi:hypothetical protein